MSEYAYRPWADDDGSGPLDEMAEGDIEKALGNYKKCLMHENWINLPPLPNSLKRIRNGLNGPIPRLSIW